ncbi:uncharacterized protein LOC100884115 [Megachile rotundata]|uniref:uncharacterized protein LOC100884115 n=1 Tax=Megachile rotundata TaxID=143995 RepID=UPI003FCFB1E6
MRLLHSKDRSIIWTLFLIKVVGIWIANNRAEQLRRNLALVYTLTALSIAMGIALRDLHFSWGNFNDCVYIFCNILYLMNGFFKIAVLSAHKRKFFDIVLCTEQTFMPPTDDQTERKILMDCKRLCDWFIVFIMFCVQGGCSGYAITPFVENIGKNESERILPFNLWIDFPTGMSPYFEVFFTIQVSVTLYILQHSLLAYVSKAPLFCE